MNLPDIRQLTIFIALEETRSFTAAAKSCFITQSAVSHSIKSLEKQLDCALIERIGKRIILTPYGEVFLHHAKRVIAELEISLNKLEKIKLWGYSSLNIAVPNSICQFVLPQTIKDFAQKHPKCELSINIADTEKATQMVEAGQIDLCLGLQQVPQNQKLNFLPIATDELCFITQPDHPWTKQPASERLDLSDVRLIAYAKESETKRLMNSHFKQHEIHHHQPLSVGNMEAIKEMTKHGVGVGIISDWIARDELKEGTLKKHTISNPPPKRQWGIFTSAHKRLSLPEEDFLSLIKEHMNAAIKDQAASQN